MLGKTALTSTTSSTDDAQANVASQHAMFVTGGTRFIGVYLARQLIEAGHEVTLLTRGKKPVTFQIPDDTDESFEKYKSAVKHIAADRTDADALKQQLSGAGFQGVECTQRSLILALSHATGNAKVSDDQLKAVSEHQV